MCPWRDTDCGIRSYPDILLEPDRPPPWVVMYGPERLHSTYKSKTSYFNNPTIERLYLTHTNTPPYPIHDSEQAQHFHLSNAPVLLPADPAIGTEHDDFSTPHRALSLRIRA